jgi:hypothetical protein
MASLFHAFNALLPFTNPSTPLWRDIIHTLVLCTALYLAPNVDWQKVFDSFRRPQTAIPPEQEEQILQEDPGRRASDAAKREEETRAEWQRRMVVEAQIKEKERRAREEKKEKEERERREEIEALRRAGEIITEGLEQKRMIKVEEVAKAVKRDEKWVEQLVRREGILGTKMLDDGKKKVTILTGRGWLVRIDEETMNEAYNKAAKSSEGGGKVSWEELGIIIQEVLVNSSN